MINLSDSGESDDDDEQMISDTLNHTMGSQEEEEEEGDSEEEQSDIEILEGTFEPIYTSKPRNLPTTGQDNQSNLLDKDYFPKPSVSKLFNIRNALPRRNPPDDFQGEKIKRKLGPNGGEFNWSLEGISQAKTIKKNLKAKGKEKEQAKELSKHIWHTAAFFPYSHLPGLDFMKDVAAIAGGAQVELVQIADISESDPNVSYPDFQNGGRIKVDHLARIVSPLDDSGLPEDFHTCAWSVNIFAWPYIPILAVAGRGKVIEIYQFFSHPLKSNILEILHERSITGHGAAIYDLKFSLSHPHFLASASDDGTIRLWSSQIPSGSNSAMKSKIEKKIKKANAELTSDRAGGGEKGSRKSRNGNRIWKLGDGPVERHLVEGEMLGLLGDEGHRGGALSCDIHPILPLLVSSGRDGTIKICTFPFELRGPTWPKSTTTATHTLLPSSLVTPIILEALFTSAAIHQGQLVDQVAWSSSIDCSIISKSNSTYTLDVPSTNSAFVKILPPPLRPKIQKSIKIWTATVLHSFLSSTDSNSAQEWYELRKEAKLRREVDGISDDLKFDYGVENDYFDFRIELEMRIEGDGNFVGDSVGILRKPLFTSSSKGLEERVEETMIFVPHYMNSTLEVFKPFSLSSIFNPNLAPQDRPEIVEALFPQEGIRQREFVPEILPSRILKLKERKEGVLPVHIRCIAIQSEGGKWMLGVGDDGVLAFWRRRKV